MKMVTLYSLKSQKVVYHGKDVTVREYQPFDLRKAMTLDNGARIESAVTEKALPVERIRMIEHGLRKDHLIAMDDDLREILEAPFRGKMDELAQSVGEWRRTAKLLQMRIHLFNSLPWWKRLFLKV